MIWLSICMSLWMIVCKTNTLDLPPKSFSYHWHFLPLLSPSEPSSYVTEGLFAPGLSITNLVRSVIGSAPAIALVAHQQPRSWCRWPAPPSHHPQQRRASVILAPFQEVHLLGTANVEGQSSPNMALWVNVFISESQQRQSWACHQQRAQASQLGPCC